MPSTRLKSGEKLAVTIMEPPLLEYASKTPGSELLDWCWPQVKDDMLAGWMRKWLFTPYALGELDGELVGSMAYYTATELRDVGVIEFVQTAEAHRSKGISSALLGALIERFTSEGGLALYLCTANPIAGSLYEKHGFDYLIGDGMRFLTESARDFDESYLSFDGDAIVRDATWADLARTTVLYNLPEPHWLVKDYLTGSFHNTRYESHFVRLMRRVENSRGTFQVLQNPAGRVVGAAVVERLDTYFEQHCATLSFRVCPEYMHQTPKLLEKAVSQAAQMGIVILQIQVADRDADQQALITTSGFSEETRFKDRLRDDYGWTDLLVYTRRLVDDAPPARDEGEYYGGRHPWQTERVSRREKGWPSPQSSS